MSDLSLHENESDEEETTPDRRFTRCSSETLYREEIDGLVWIGYEGFDTDEGRECHWIKVTFEGKTDAAEARLQDVLRNLQAWRRYQHPLLLR
jgi:hypothetical protein